MLAPLFVLSSRTSPHDKENAQFSRMHGSEPGVPAAGEYLGNLRISPEHSIPIPMPYCSRDVDEKGAKKRVSPEAGSPRLSVKERPANVVRCCKCR